MLIAEIISDVSHNHDGAPSLIRTMTSHQQDGKSILIEALLNESYLIFCNNGYHQVFISNSRTQSGQIICLI